MELKNIFKWSILFDIIIISFSLMISWSIRSNFNFFFYQLQEFVFLFPWVIISRIILNIFFGIYTFSPSSLNNKDIKSIIEYNIVPTLMLLIFRILNFKNELLIMPISMIAMEYVFSTIGFIILRIILNATAVKRLEVIGYVRRIVLWAEIYELEKLINFDAIEPNLKIEGIINQNPLFWNTDYGSIRVYGDEKELYTILSADDRISSIVFTEEMSLNKKQKKNIIEIVEKLNLDIGLIKENKFYLKTKKWLIDSL